MNTEFSVALKREPLSPLPPPTTTQTQRGTSSLANYKDMEYICRLLNNVPTTTLSSFGEGEKPPVRYYDPLNYAVMKNSISSSISSSSSFDDGEELPFGPTERFDYDYDADDYMIDEDNDSFCDEVINELLSDDINNAELPIIGMLLTQGMDIKIL